MIAVAVLTLATAGCSGSPDEAAPHPSLAIANLNEVPNDGAALYSISYELYLTDSAGDGLVAVSEKDPFRGCRIQSVEPGDDANGLATQPGTRFVDPCHGSQYDVAGRYLSGPSNQDLRRIPIEVVGGTVFIDGTAERNE